MDDKFIEDSKTIEDLRKKANDALGIANTAGARANDVSGRVGHIESEVIEITVKLRDRGLALEKLQKAVDQLPDVSTQLAEARMALQEYDHLNTELQAKNGWIHLGMIVPYFGSKLPNGFVWADGTTKWPAQPWVPEHLRDQEVPNLNGRLLRGAKGGETIGGRGGTDVIAMHSTKNSGNHAHAIPDHQHTLPDYTGPISLDPEIPGGSRYSVRDDHNEQRYQWGDNDPKSKAPAHHIRVDEGKSDSGQHSHKLDGTTSLSSGAKTSSNGEYAHEIGAVSFVPSYVPVNFIIRVR